MEIESKASELLDRLICLFCFQENSTSYRIWRLQISFSENGILSELLIENLPYQENN